MNLSFRVVLFAATATLATGYPAAAQTNLVRNGAFESGPVFFAPTSVWVSVPPWAGASQTTAHSGTTSVVFGTGTPFNYSGEIVQLLPTTVGQQYTVSFWGRSFNDSTTGRLWAEFIPAYEDPNPMNQYGLARFHFTGPVSYFNADTPGTQWQFVTGNLTATSSGTALMLIGNYSYIDDISVVATTTPEPSSVVIVGTGLLALIPVARRRTR